MSVKKGDKIKVNYKGSLEDGTVFDESKEPIAFEVGSGQLIKGFDDAVVGMDIGQEKEITIKPEEAYGQRVDQMVAKVPREKLGGDPKPGMGVMFKGPDGKQLPGKIIEVDDKEITVDFNHPLAGKTLKFKIKLEEIQEAKKDSDKEESKSEE